MKELEIIKKEEIVIVDEQKKELKHIAQLKPSPGHKCFELNIETGEIKEAEFNVLPVAYPAGKLRKMSIGVQKKIVIKEKHLYTTALNVKNAIKRFTKMTSK